MNKKTFSFKGKNNVKVFVYRWMPDNNENIKGIVQISHGMAETAKRYERFAKYLTENGFMVYANDHRGHGKTCGNVDKLGDLGEDGFNNMVKDMHTLQNIIKKEKPNIPIFIFGHSMGSFLLQRYICLYGKEINGAILSGSCGKQGFLLKIGKFIAKREIKKIGRKGKSYKLNKMSFGSYNNKFKPNRTEFDWLTRDEKEVDKYVDDPYCGAVFTAGFFYDFFEGLILNEKRKEIKKIPKELPIYILSGDNDPVGKNGKGVMKLVKTYQKHGIKDLEYKLYKDCRHELLNEKNREEVFKDIVNWLNKHVN